MILGLILGLCVGIVMIAGTGWVLMMIGQSIMKMWKEITRNDNEN